MSWDFVAPNLQGVGIGSMILNHRIEFLKSFPAVQKISVRTSQHAYQFYQKNGFVLKEIERDYWAKGFDLYKMILE